MSGSKASQDLFTTVDGVVVSADDPGARFLLVRAGKEIPDGYSEPKGKKEADKPANKQASKPDNK